MSAAAAVSPRATRILVVDDEDTIRLVFGRFLRSRGFDVDLAESGEAALEKLSGAPFDMMVCDVRMPGLSGIEIVAPALRQTPDLGIVMLSAVNDAPTATEAIKLGALDYLTKPVELQALYESVERALHKRTLLKERRRLEFTVREEVALRTQGLEREKEHLCEMTVNVVDSLVTAMEANGEFLRGHSTRVAELAASIAGCMRLAPDLVEDVRIAGRLHDVGNIGVRGSVLSKPGRFTPEELAHVRTHVAIGVEILKPLRHIERAVAFVADHHEHWNGGGYPFGKTGDAISLGGRIVTAADVFDAITSRRSYRDQLGPAQAAEFIAAQAGKMLDTPVCEALSAVIRHRRSLALIDPGGIAAAR
jgi:response regulator RpfG family c-di-GMP phosphodiesterase